MNWEAIGAIGEILGALTVLITLIYLSLQIRQNTHQIRESATQDSIHLWNSIGQTILSNPDVASLIEKGDASLTNLSVEERQQYFQYCMMTFRAAWAQDRNVRAGTTEYNDLEVIEWIKEWMDRSPGFRETWSEVRHYFPHDFQDRVQDLTNETASTNET